MPPTNGSDADVCGFAGRAVAEAGDGAVVAGRWYQTRNGDHVGGGGLRLKGLRKRKKRSDLYSRQRQRAERLLTPASC